MNRSFILWMILASQTVGLSGCGDSGGPVVWVTGRLLKGGVKYDPPANQLVSVTFVAMEAQDAQGTVTPSTEPYLAELDPSTGLFKVPGKGGSGIPPGKYRIAVTQRMTREAFAGLKTKAKGVTRETDYLGNKFGVTTSPIVREIKASTDLIIDLDKPTEGAPAD